MIDFNKKKSKYLTIFKLQYTNKCKNNETGNTWYGGLVRSIHIKKKKQKKPKMELNQINSKMADHVRNYKYKNYFLQKKQPVGKHLYIFLHWIKLRV